MTGDVVSWLESLGLAKYAEPFVNHEVTLEDLSELTEDDLREMGLPIGPRRRIMKSIGGLSALDAKQSGMMQPAVAGQPDDAPGAERRQLTIMFCDLVGSTELSRRLDPEDLREVMRRYQDAAAGAITRYGGHVAKYLGDGILSYFGWPQAFEDQAERGVRAGLDAVAAVETIDAGGLGALSARVGIASGQVVIGDLSGETDAISGETPNLAARLQQVAEPGQVVIGEATRRLIADAFSLMSLEPQTLKGYSDPVSSYVVEAEGKRESRFKIQHGRHLTGFIGRLGELTILRDRWSVASHGEGQVVLIPGEAGMGKSRLAEECSRELGTEHPMRLLYQCSPYHTNSAFYPVIRQLEFAARIESGDDDKVRLGKLEMLLDASVREKSRDIALVANLLSIPLGESYPELTGNAQERKRETVDALIGQLLALSRDSPVLFLVEDAHWIDPSTSELIEKTVDAIADNRVLLLVTHRPEWRAPFAGKSNVTVLSVNRLPRKDADELTRSVAGAVVSDDLISGIVEQTDGVPLYVEEFARAVLEADATDSNTYGQVPETLQASLTARLDRLGEARDVAQIASVIGRTFSLDLLAEVTGAQPERLARNLGELTAAGLIYEAGRTGDKVFIFKHALIQEAARDGLLRARRRELHGHIAVVLENRHPDLVGREPEVLAQHFAEADQIEKAVDYGQKAGALALARSAMQEARSHYRSAIDLIRRQPNPDSQMEQELDCRVALGPVLVLTTGPGDEVEQHYREAETLAERIGDNVKMFEVKWGKWWSEHIFLDDLDLAGKTARELIELGRRQNDTGMLLQAYHSAWTSGFARDPLPEIVEHVQAGLALYDPQKHLSHIDRYGGHDAGCCAHNFLAMSYCLLGKLDSAAEQSARSLVNARRVKHEFTEVFTHSFGCTIYYLRRDYAEVIDKVAELERVSHKTPAFAHFGTTPNLLRACAIALPQPGETDLTQIDEALSVIVESGFPRLGFQYAVTADVYCQAGLLDRAEELAGMAQDTIEKTRETRWLADVLRIRGDVFAARGETSWDEAETVYRDALSIAREQGARYFELRAATPMARICYEKGRLSEARSLLEPIYLTFDEGLELPDLVAARTLLDQLS